MSREVREGGKGIKLFPPSFPSRDLFRCVDADGEGSYLVASRK